MASYPSDLERLKGAQNVAANNLIAALVPNKPDKEIADELRKKFFEALQPVAALIVEAESNGFEVGFQFGKDAFGKAQIQVINLLKKY